MKYKVGDRVRVQSLDWYEKNKNKLGNVPLGRPRLGQFSFNFCNTHLCGAILTIKKVQHDYYLVEENSAYWTDEMIEGLVEDETKPKFNVGDRVITNKGYVGKFEGWVSDYQVRVLFEESGDNVVIHPKNLKLVEEETVLNKWTGLKVELELSKTVIDVSNVESLHGERFMSGFVKAIIPPEGYIFKDENGNVINATKIVLEKKKKEYPKTYEECLNVLGYEDIATHCIFHTEADEKLFNTLYDLKVCRDAYWKIAGEEMGLGKPWEPQEGVIYSYMSGAPSYIRNIFPFPTSEMRDAFKENFDTDIKKCKEFL